MDQKMALKGFRVLDLTHVLSGPYCTMLLADMGAEVIKIEKHGEYDRSAVPLIKGESYFYMVLNRNKKGITLNLKHEKGIEILKELKAIDKEVPVIIMTAFAGAPQIPIEAYQNDCFDIILKPFKLKEISAIIERKRDLMDSIVREDDPGLLKSFTREQQIELLADPS